MAKLKAKQIHSEPKKYKIQNKKTKLWLAITGVESRLIWVSLRYLADSFSIISIENLEKRYPELKLNECNKIEITKNELDEDKEKIYKRKS